MMKQQTGFSHLEFSVIFHSKKDEAVTHKDSERQTNKSDKTKSTKVIKQREEEYILGKNENNIK